MRASGERRIIVEAGDDDAGDDFDREGDENAEQSVVLPRVEVALRRSRVDVDVGSGLNREDDDREENEN